MDRCASCGAGLPAEADWCGQCFAARRPASSGSVVGAAGGAVAFAAGGALTTFGRVGVAPPATLPAPQRVTRWRKTPTTFGPAGRLLCTVGLLVPLVLMIIGGLADPFVWGGAGVWLGIVMPWALRDIWKSGRLPAT